MHFGSLSHLSDKALLREFTHAAERERRCTAELIAYMGEVERRRLYARENSPSMFRFCVDRLHFSEHAAYRRIQVARAARKYPAILPALADGRLTLSSVLMLRPYLTRANAAGLLAAAVHRTRPQLEELIAERFPRPDVPARVVAVAPVPAPEPRPSVEAAATPPVPNTCDVNAPSGELAPELVAHACVAAKPLAANDMAPRARVTPLSPGHYEVTFTFEREAHDLMRYAQALASHDVGPNELAKLFTLALKSFVRERERRKFAACVRAPRAAKPGRKPSANPRHVPAAVRREVWLRDGGRCTFVSESGERCAACEHLEFDHATPVANGGESSAANLSLRCRTHNQLAAEQVFGAARVEGGRERSRRRVVESRLAKSREAQRARERARAPGRSPASDGAQPQLSAPVSLPPAGSSHAREAAATVAAAVDAADAAERTREEVIPWLRALGVRLEDARRAVAAAGAPPEAPLEARVRAALRQLGPRGTRRVPAPGPAPTTAQAGRPAA